MARSYEVCNWPSGLNDKSYRVRVQTSPGKFEGEPIWTELFYIATLYADESIYKGVEESEWIADCFRAPFNLDTLAQGEARLALSEIELEYLNAQAGAILTEDSHGFVKVRLFNTMSDYDSAIREIRSTM